MLLLAASFNTQAQQLDVTITNIGSNRIRIEGTATGSGFASAPNDMWTAMNLSWRVPKSVADPAPTVIPPAPTPEVTGETTAFTGASPRDVLTNGMDLSIFDLTSFGLPDDGYWYFQIVGTTESVQSIPTGSTVVLYEFSLPQPWECAACVEILTFDIPDLPIATASFIDNAGTGTNVMNLSLNNAPLPVRFINFEVSRKGEAALLEWQVSNETNVKGYHLERSFSGTNWETIGFVAFQQAQGSVNDYAFTDAGLHTDITYYRIRQEDLDGKVNYSVVRTIRMNAGGMQVKLYPVPLTNVLNVNTQSTIEGPATMRFTDALGQTIRTFKVELKKGGQTHQLRLGDFKPGIYYIQILAKDFKWSEKIVKE